MEEPKRTARKESSAESPRGTARARPPRKMSIDKASAKKLIEEVIDEVRAGLPPPVDDPIKQDLHTVAHAALMEVDRMEYKPGQLAKAMAEMELMACVAFLVQVRNGNVPGYPYVPISERRLAAESLLSRGGLPPVTQNEIKGSLITAKLVVFEKAEPPGLRVDGPSAAEDVTDEARQH